MRSSSKQAMRPNPFGLFQRKPAAPPAPVRRARRVTRSTLIRQAEAADRVRFSADERARGWSVRYDELTTARAKADAQKRYNSWRRKSDAAKARAKRLYERAGLLDERGAVRPMLGGFF